MIKKISLEPLVKKNQRLFGIQEILHDTSLHMVHFGSAKLKDEQSSVSETGFQFISSFEVKAKMLFTAFGELTFDIVESNGFPPYIPLSDGEEVDKCCEERTDDGDPRNLKVPLFKTNKAHFEILCKYFNSKPINPLLTRAGGRKSVLAIERGVSGFHIEDDASTDIDETFDDVSGNSWKTGGLLGDG